VLVAPIPPPKVEADNELLVPPQERRLPFTRTTNASTSPFAPVWANEKWHNLTQGNQLLDCMSIDTGREMGDWISGAKAARQASALQAQTSLQSGQRSSPDSAFRPGRRPRQPAEPSVRQLDGAASERRREDLLSPRSLDADDSNDLNQITPTLARSRAMAPAGFWEPEVPYEDYSSVSGRSASSTGATGIEDTDSTHPGPFTLTLELVDPGLVTLEMTKTFLPIFKTNRAGARTMVETDSFIIITTVPRSGFVMKSGADLHRTSIHADTTKDVPMQTEDHEMGENEYKQVEPHSLKPRTKIISNPLIPPRSLSISPLPTLNLSISNPQMTPTDEIMALELVDQTLSQAGQTSRPLYFSSDGTVSRARGALMSGVDDRGKPLDVHVLLEATDWSKTALGPREQWPQSLKTVGESHGDAINCIELIN
jgi:hypothetical protein